jgi:hypothetical protein
MTNNRYWQLSIQGVDGIRDQLKAPNAHVQTHAIACSDWRKPWETCVRVPGHREDIWNLSISCPQTRRPPTRHLILSRYFKSRVPAIVLSENLWTCIYYCSGTYPSKRRVLLTQRHSVASPRTWILGEYARGNRRRSFRVALPLPNPSHNFSFKTRHTM